MSENIEVIHTDALKVKEYKTLKSAALVTQEGRVLAQLSTDSAETLAYQQFKLLRAAMLDSLNSTTEQAAVAFWNPHKKQLFTASKDTIVSYTLDASPAHLERNLSLKEDKTLLWRGKEYAPDELKL